MNKHNAISDVLPTRSMSSFARQPHPPRPILVPRRSVAPAMVQQAGPKYVANKTKRRFAQVARRLQYFETHSPMLERGAFRARFAGMFTKRRLFSGLATAIVLLTVYVSVDTWLTNRSITSITTQAAAKEKDSGSTQTVLDGNTRPDETPLPKGALKNYQVAGPNPRAIYINKIGLSARILPMSVGKDGALQAPANIYDTGWYTGSVLPGETGAMLIDAHSSGGTVNAAFDKLHKLVAGDIITLETGDGTQYNYKVAAAETSHKDEVDMQKALLPYDNAQQGLNLITCSGTFTKDYTTMSDRLVVYAIRAD